MLQLFKITQADSSSKPSSSFMIQNLHVACSIRLGPMHLSCHLYLYATNTMKFILHSSESPQSPSEMQMCTNIMQTPNQQ